MCKWNAVCRRFVAVVVLLAGLIVLPAMPAFATGDSEGEAPQEDAGLIEQAIDWLVDLLAGEDGAAEGQEGDNGPTWDPSGRR